MCCLSAECDKCVLFLSYCIKTFCLVQALSISHATGYYDLGNIDMNELLNCGRPVNLPIQSKESEFLRCGLPLKEQCCSTCIYFSFSEKI
jgi:hypothetical protein